MKLSAKEDIKAPVDEVFARLIDYPAHERAVMRRGVKIRRLDGLTSIEPGMCWVADMKFRGKPRQVTAQLLQISPEELLNYSVEGSGLAGTFDLEVLALSPRKTRLSVALEIKPKNLTGRLLMQSLRLLKSSMNRRFKARFSDYAAAIEANKF